MPRGAFAEFERSIVEPDPSIKLHEVNNNDSDEGRKRHLAAYARTMRGQPGFEEVASKLGISVSDSEEEEVPSLDKMLANLDAEESERMGDYGKPIFTRDPTKDATRSFLGSAVDSPTKTRNAVISRESGSAAMSAVKAPAAPTSAAPEKEAKPRWQVLAANSPPKKEAKSRWEVLAADSPNRSQGRQPMGGAKKESNWQAKKAEAEARRAREEEEKAELKRQQDAKLRSEGWTLLNTDLFVKSTSVTAAGAAAEVCNGSYSFECNHKGRPLFKNDSGAIIYFNEFWKMNSSYKVTSWLYGVASATGPLPPVGPWTAENSKGVTVTASKQKSQVQAEKDTQIMLMDGQLLQKNMENKSWRRVDPESVEEDDKENTRTMASLKPN